MILEQYTSASNGVCPDGIVYMDKIMSENPGKVIGINFHKDDGMQLDDGIVTLIFFEPDTKKQILPTATIHRAEVSDPINKDYFLLPRANWKFLIDQYLTIKPKMEVLLNWKYNPDTKKISGTISCTTIKDLNYQFAFQIIICENNVSGTGPGFDQVNEYNDYEGHPFYKLGNPIKGYKHNRVARGFIGGLAGNRGDFPATVKAGVTYQWDFEADMPNVPAGAPIKPEDVFLVGIVGESQESFVYSLWDCVETREIKSYVILSNKVIAFGNTQVDITIEKAITISNNGAEDLSIDGISITGDDETAFKFDDIAYPKVVKPGESFELVVKFHPSTVKDYSAVLEILSNDKYNPKVSVNLTGTGSSSSVDDGEICNLSILPNPAGDFITIKLGAINPTVNRGFDEVTIYNTLGECVMSESIHSMTDSHRMNIETLPRGIYFMKVGGVTSKFVKM